jgi:succinoglycan biosynthesis protein ExoV
MMLYQWRGDTPNFGDELNNLLWPRLLPDFFDSDPGTRFLGIGSILDDRHRGARTKLVAGSGYGGYEPRAALDRSWIIHWVRGPWTARQLGLPPALGLGDPATLLPLAGFPGAAPSEAVRGNEIGFMPHFESMTYGAWQQAAPLAGVTLIDPRDDPATVLAAIGRCRILISEALHGVIVADAMRIPWIAVQPLARIHRAKWWDWADTQDIKLVFRHLPASSLLAWAAASGLAGLHRGRALLDRQDKRLRTAAAASFVTRAAAALRRVAAAQPQLSDDVALNRCQTRMQERIDILRQQPYRGSAIATSSALCSRSLDRYDGSAFNLGSIG